MPRLRAMCVGLAAATTAALALVTVSAATGPGALTFSNIPLLTTDGDSEPAVSIGPGATVAVTGLS